MSVSEPRVGQAQIVAISLSRSTAVSQRQCCVSAGARPQPPSLLQGDTCSRTHRVTSTLRWLNR